MPWAPPVFVRERIRRRLLRALARASGASHANDVARGGGGTAADPAPSVEQEASPTPARNLLVPGARTRQIEARYTVWRERHDPDPVELARQRAERKLFGFQPLFSVVVPVYDPPLEVLAETVASVLAQTYDRFELCLADGGQQRASAEYLDRLSAGNPRVKLTRLEKNLGISGNSNAALTLADGEFVAFLDHDDLLAPHALFAVATALNAEPDLDVIYSDEDRLAPDGQRLLPFLKPDWSPEFLHSFMWPLHLMVYRRSLVESLGGFRPAFDGSQDYDLMLRAAAVTDRIAHVPQVLYHWRMVKGSAAAGGKNYARRTNLAALDDAVAAQRRTAEIADWSYANRVVFDLGQRPLVSIIFATDELERARAQIAELVARTSYERFEILVVTNSTVAAALEQEFGTSRVRCARYDGGANVALARNIGAAAAKGDYLLFLDDDIRPLTEDWIESMLQYAQLPEIGGVSPKLLYADESIADGGGVTAVRGLVGAAFRGWPRSDWSYHCMALALRNVSCLSGACMLVRAETFRVAGGFDATNTPMRHFPFDLSCRLRDAGLRLVYTPFAELSQGERAWSDHGPHEPESFAGQRDRGADVYLLRRWGKHVGSDPYYTAGMRSLLDEDGGSYQVLAPEGAPLDAGWWERPRVLLLSECLPRPDVGTTMQLGMALERAGMVVVAAAADGGAIADAYVEAGIPVVLDPKILGNPRSAGRFLRNFDVIGVQSVGALRAVEAAGREDAPIVWMVEEADIPDSAASLRATDHVVFPSSETAARYARRHGLRRHVVVHAGIEDVARIAQAAPAVDRVGDEIVVSVDARHGLEMLIGAAGLLPRALAQRVRIVVVSGPLEPAAALRRDPEAGGARVEPVGAVAREKALAYVRDSDVFVWAARDGRGSSAVTEAMALATPVIATAVGAPADIITPGIDGELIRADSPPQLAEHLELLAADPLRRERLGLAARKTYERKLTIDCYLDTLVGVFREALNAERAETGTR